MSAAAAPISTAHVRSHRREMVVGLVVGVVAVLPAIFMTHSQARLALAIALAGIGWVYLGFAVADGRPSAIAVQAVSAAAFLWIAYAAVQLESTALVGTGFAAHAAWDAIHHEGHGPTRVRSWWPPFCAVCDLAIAVPLLAGWL